MERILIELGIHVGAAAVTVLVGLAIVRTRMHAAERRLEEMERQFKTLGKDFVPRLELTALLSGVERMTKQTNAMVQALFYRNAGRSAIKALQASGEAVDHVALFLGGLPDREARVPWMYLDSEGNVTVGDGEELPNIHAAQSLPFRHMASGVLATSEEIAAAFTRVSHMLPNHTSTFYRNDSALILTTADIEELDRKRVRGFEEDLSHIFPDYDEYPTWAKVGLLDMIWNLGASRLQHEYVNFCPAVLDENWIEAATECDREVHKSAWARRNAWTRACFAKAAAA